MAKILVHVTHGPEHPNRAALGFMVARCSVEEGQAVSLFLAGDAVQLLRDPVLDNVVGLGTGKLRESYDIIVAGGGRFYLSVLSSNAGGISQAELAGKPAELVMPKVLVQLPLEHDQMFTYYPRSKPSFPQRRRRPSLVAFDRFRQWNRGRFGGQVIPWE